MDLNPEDLRESVAVYRHPRTPDYERKSIVGWWATYDIPNQFAALIRAAEIEKEEN